MGKDIEAQPSEVSRVDSLADKSLATSDVDGALQFLRTHAADDHDQIDDKKLMRKIDFMMMPLMFACYYLQYTDKTLLSYAAVMRIIEDTNMPDSGFSHMTMAFYVSFLVFEPLQSYAVQKFPTAKYLGVMVTLWGIVVTMNSACHSFAPVMALRVLLGCLEACVAPSLVILTSKFYKREEQVVRMGIWYQETSFGPAVSSLASFGFLHWVRSHPNAPFRAWQILFLLFGLITVVVGILVFLFLPDSPMASRLSDAEKIHIINRVRSGQTGIENKKIKWKQIKEILLDLRTYILALIVITINVPNGAVSSFQSIIISNFGYGDYTTLLLNLPGAAISFVCVGFGTWWAGRRNSRGVVVIALIVPTLLGGALMAWLPASDTSGLLAGMFLTNTVGASLPMLYSWITANHAGHTKKSTMSAVILMSFCVGNIVGPETFQEKDAPAYIPAKITIVAVLSVAIILTVSLELLYWWDNKKRDEEGLQAMAEDADLADLTDKENRNFRYLL